MELEQNREAIVGEFDKAYYDRACEAYSLINKDPNAACSKLRDLLIATLKKIAKRKGIERHRFGVKDFLGNSRLKSEVSIREEKLISQINGRRNRSSYDFDEDEYDAKRSFEDFARLLDWYFKKYTKIELIQMMATEKHFTRELELWVNKVSFVDAGWAYQQRQKELSKPVDSDAIDFVRIRQRKHFDRPPAEYDTLTFEYYFKNNTGSRVDEFTINFETDKEVFIFHSSCGEVHHVGFESSISQSFKPTSSILRRINLLNGANSKNFEIYLKLERGSYDGIQKKVLKDLPSLRFEILLPDLPPVKGSIDFNKLKEAKFPLKVS